MQLEQRKGPDLQPMQLRQDYAVHRMDIQK